MSGLVWFQTEYKHVINTLKEHLSVERYIGPGHEFITV